MLMGMLIASQAARASEKHQCNVSVSDKVGALIKGAHVYVYRDMLFGNAFEKTFIADGKGTVRFSVVDGWYDICVVGGAFAPQCREVDVEGKDVSVQFTLTVSTAMGKQIGYKAD